MLKVLLVDDEILSRNRLRNMYNWEEHGFTICGEAPSGKSALKIIEQLSPEIVIFDIHMPQMDGVLLSRHIAEKYPNIRMIAISSYDNYDYVAEVLKVGAADYLLKHRLSSEVIGNALSKCRQQIENDKTIDIINRDHKAWERFGGLAQQRCLRQIFSGEYTNDLESADSGALEMWFPDSQYYPAVLKLQTVGNVLYTNSYEGTVISAMEQLCGQILKESVNGISAYVDNAFFAFLFIFEKNSNIKQARSDIEDYFNRLKKSLSMYFEANTVYEVGILCDNADNLGVEFARIKKNMESPYVRENIMEKEDAPIIGIKISDEKALLTSIENMDEKETFEIINRILNKDSVRFCAIELTDILTKTAIKHRISITDVVDSRNQEKINLWLFNNTEEFTVLIKKCYSRLISLIEDRFPIPGGSNYSKYTKEAIRYIYRNIGEDISLDSLAEALNVSASYISRLFKQETGMPFVEYLNRKKIEKAISLISQNHYKIKDVYKKAGFYSYNYFFKVFKEITGYTPLEFKKRQEGKK